MATLAELRAEAKRQKRKGYSKLKKAELEKLLDTPPPKPPRGVPRKKPEPAPAPIAKAESPAKKEPTTISGKNILVNSQFEKPLDANRTNRDLGYKASELKRGSVKGFSADGSFKETRFLYFVKDLPATPLRRLKGYSVEADFKKEAMRYGDYFNPLTDPEPKGSAPILRNYKISKLNDAEIKKRIGQDQRGKGATSMMYYLNTPELFKKSYPYLGVYETILMNGKKLLIK
jgi:hypothetical protein